MEEEEKEYRYWKIWYISCEDNSRWTIARSPTDWEANDVQDRIPIGGSGDDVAEIVSVYDTNDTNYYWDFTD